VCECLRKKHNWSVSIRFNSQLRGWLLAQGLGERSPEGTLFRGPTATERPETEGQDRNQLETSRGEEFSERGTIFFNYVQWFLTLSSTFFQENKILSRGAFFCFSFHYEYLISNCCFSTLVKK